MSSKPRGNECCSGEERHMVDNIHIIKYCNIAEWDFVLAFHNEEYADKDQDITSLRKKLVTLHCKHPGTRNQNIPDGIQDVKFALYKIKQKAECISGNESEDNEKYLGEDTIKYFKKKSNEESVAMNVKEE
eukprot:7256278-Ditylum_brightwellii.AAC.1